MDWTYFSAAFGIASALIGVGFWIASVTFKIKETRNKQKKAQKSMNVMQANQKATSDSVKAMTASVKEVQARQKAVNDSVKEVQAGQKAVNDSVKEVQAGQKAVNDSAKAMTDSVNELQARQKATTDSVKEMQARQKATTDSVSELQARQKATSDSVKAMADSVSELQANQKATSDSVKAMADSVKILQKNQQRGTIRLRNLNTRVRTLDKRLTGLIDRATKALTQFQASETKGLSVPKSPVSLTERGKTMSEKIGADKIASLYESEAFRQTDGMNAYEVQEYCFGFAENLAENLKKDHSQRYQQLSHAAFESGDNVDMLLRVVVGLLLRDRVLEKRNMAHADAGRQTVK